MSPSPPCPVLFLPHGGGPLPLLGDQDHQALASFLRGLAPSLGRPESILMISAHWEESQPTLSSGVSPSLIYDYYGFPDAAYQLEYPASGNPELAVKITRLLQASGIDAKQDDQRGFDHGMFVPLKLIYPLADIPCVQLSLVTNMDPLTHLKIGQALSALRDENVLIIGSGFSFHNMPAFGALTQGRPDHKNDAFEGWLIDTCTNPDLSATERNHRLTHWMDAPFGRYCHPREEHLLPLLVCAGIAGTPARLVFSDRVLGAKTCAFLW